MNILFGIKQAIDWLLKALLAVLFLTLFGCVILQVFTRYVLNDPAIFTEEVSRYAMIWLSLLGAAYACGRIEHMAYTMLPDKLGGEKLYMHMRSVAVIVMLFALSVMVYGGGRLMLRTYDFNQLTATMQWPMAYVYLCIPLSGVLIVFYQILILIKPSHFKSVDEVKAALAHAEEENKKLEQAGNSDNATGTGA